jgi:hypothetical protein
MPSFQSEEKFMITISRGRVAPACASGLAASLGPAGYRIDGEAVAPHRGARHP